MKKKIKRIVIIVLIILAGIGIFSGVSYYRNSKAKDTTPLETVLEKSSDLTTQKLVITDVFECSKINSDDLKIYDTGFAILNVNQDDLLEVVSEAESRAKEQANSSEYGLLDAADANATNIVRGLFENVADGREVVVEFK